MDGSSAENIFLLNCITDLINSNEHGRQKLEFPEIAQNHDCGGSMVPSGYIVHQDTFSIEIS